MPATIMLMPLRDGEPPPTGETIIQEDGTLAAVYQFSRLWPGLKSRYIFGPMTSDQQGISLLFDFDVALRAGKAEEWLAPYLAPLPEPPVTPDSPYPPSPS